MRVQEKLTGSHLYEDAIAKAAVGCRVIAIRRLAKPGQWIVTDAEGEHLGTLNASSAIATRLNAGNRVASAFLSRIVGPTDRRPSTRIEVEFVFSDL